VAEITKGAYIEIWGKINSLNKRLRERRSRVRMGVQIKIDETKSKAKAISALENHLESTSFETREMATERKSIQEE
jgi:glutathionylspermidine synthase